MKIGTLEKKLGVWQFGIEILPRMYDRFSFSPNVRIWALKLLSLPEPGSMLTQENYRGLGVKHFYLDWGETTIEEKGAIPYDTGKAVPSLWEVIVRAVLIYWCGSFPDYS